MNPIIRILSCGMAVALFLVAPVAAAQVLTGDSFTPNPPLVAGAQQQVVATYAIASGTTFPKNHELQMTTNLTGAMWTIQVILDGNNAATQTAAGNAAFVNGELLSYSANHDVSFSVTIDGVVPPADSGQAMVLQVEEIDNTGNVVPGSASVISQPVAGGAVVPVTTVVPTLTPVPVTPATPAPTRSPGFAAGAGILALAGAVVGAVWMRSPRP